MKPLAAILTALACSGSGLRAEVEFTSYRRVEGETKFSLADPAEGRRSGLLAIGGTFDGYTLIGFDAKKEVLSVERAGVTRQLPLKPATVQRAEQTEDALATAAFSLTPWRDSKGGIEQGPRNGAGPITLRDAELGSILDRLLPLNPPASGDAATATGIENGAVVVRPIAPAGGSSRESQRASQSSGLTHVGLQPFVVRADSLVRKAQGEGGATTNKVRRLGEPVAETRAAEMLTRLQLERETAGARAEELARARQELQTMQQTYSENHPWVQSRRSYVENLERAARPGPAETPTAGPKR